MEAIISTRNTGTYTPGYTTLYTAPADRIRDTATRPQIPRRISRIIYNKLPSDSSSDSKETPTSFIKPDTSLKFS